MTAATTDRAGIVARELLLDDEQTVDSVTDVVPLQEEVVLVVLKADDDGFDNNDDGNDDVEAAAAAASTTIKPSPRDGVVVVDGSELSQFLVASDLVTTAFKWFSSPYPFFVKRCESLALLIGVIRPSSITNESDSGSDRDGEESPNSSACRCRPILLDKLLLFVTLISVL